MIEKIFSGKTPIALIVYRRYLPEGISFLSPPEDSLQLGMMARPAGYAISAHVHTPLKRRTVGTQEFLLVKSGRVRIDFYSSSRRFLKSRELRTGDCVVLCSGGHGIVFITKAVLLEVKNGPYGKQEDKVRFTGTRRQG